MDILTIDKESIVDSIYEHMKENILNGTWEPESKIPSETELCKFFNVSRVSIRGAIHKLRGRGIIATKQGKGSFVTKYLVKDSIDEMNPIVNLSKKDFLDIIEFRETIEFKSIELAVLRASEDDINEIQIALDEMIKYKDDYKKFAKADYQFHLKIVKASNNQIFYRTMSSLEDVICDYFEELRRVFGIGESLESHIEQLKAIKNRNASLAKDLINKALEAHQERFEVIYSLRKK